MIVRKLKNKDLTQLVALYEQFWGEISDITKMEQQYELMQKENTHIVLVCEENEKITGSVMGIICRELYGDCRPFLVVENMIVDKVYRRKGIGNALLTELEKIAREKNCTQMILVTEKDRADACDFYDVYGFAPNTTGYKKKL